MVNEKDLVVGKDYYHIRKSGYFDDNKIERKSYSIIKYKSKTDTIMDNERLFIFQTRYDPGWCWFKLSETYSLNSVKGKREVAMIGISEYIRLQGSIEFDDRLVFAFELALKEFPELVLKNLSDIGLHLKKQYTKLIKGKK